MSYVVTLLVNVSPPKPMQQLQTFHVKRSNDVKGTGQHWCDLDLGVK